MKWNRTAILALAAGLLVAGALVAQAPKPKAVVAQPILDVGKKPKGEKLVGEFVIRNEGNAPLEISEVRPACGCTVADFTKTIAPGQSGTIKLTIDTSDFNGPISKGATVFTSDVENPQLELTVRAIIDPYIFVKPGYARYITVQNEAKEGSIGQTLWAPDGTPFDVIKVDSPWPYLTTSFRPAKDAELQPDAKGKQWYVELHLSNGAPVGPLADMVRVTTNHPKQQIVEIPVSGFVRPVLAVTPPEGDLGKIELKEPLKRTLGVRNFATEDIKLTGAQIDNPNIEAKIEPIKEGREYVVRVILKPSLGKGPFKFTVTLTTDSPKVPTLKVPIEGTVV
jgi:hypothetical protein